MFKRTYARKHTTCTHGWWHSQNSTLSIIILVNNGVVTEQCSNNDFKVLVVEATIHCLDCILVTTGHTFVLVLLTTIIPKGRFLIEGVNVAHTKCKTIYLVTGCLVLDIAAAFTTAMMATRWLVHSGHSNQTLFPWVNKNNAMTTSPRSSIDQGNITQTIANAIII